MKTVENGYAVSLHYKGTFPDGEVFDDSRLRDMPMNVVVGQGRLLKGFEDALIGMTEGQTRSISLTAQEAYGEPNPEAIAKVPRSAFPEDYEFEIGTIVRGSSAEGTRPVIAKILAFSDEEVTLDHNHPLAGKDINFEIEVLQVKSPASESTEETPEETTTEE